MPISAGSGIQWICDRKTAPQAGRYRDRGSYDSSLPTENGAGPRTARFRNCRSIAARMSLQPTVERNVVARDSRFTSSTKSGIESPWAPSRILCTIFSRRFFCQLRGTGTDLILFDEISQRVDLRRSSPDDGKSGRFRAKWNPA